MYVGASADPPTPFNFGVTHLRTDGNPNQTYQKCSIYPIYKIHLPVWLHFAHAKRNTSKVMQLHFSSGNPNRGHATGPH